jgi:endogenous inhibitor of DNA gyrase (YacG/DUF329 family)
MVYVSRCFWCNTELEQKGRGRPRLFCSDRCRKRYRRWRESLPAVDSEEAQVLSEVLGIPADPDEAVSVELLAAYGIMQGLRSVARKARPQVAVRLVATSQALEDALREHFPFLFEQGQLLTRETARQSEELNRKEAGRG